MGRWTGGTQQAALGNNSQPKTPKISNNKHSNFTNYQAYTSQTPQLQLVASVRPSLMDPMSRKRNASDGDSGFDSALSSRSSSISLDQESPEFGKQFFAPTDFEGCDYAADLITSKLNNSLRENYLDILNKDEEISEDEDELLLITNKVTGFETLFKPPSRLTFSKSPPQVANTHSSEDYDRNNAIPRNKLFHARLEYELEKQVEKMELVNVDLVMETGLSPPPSLGIRVIGVNMIHGVPDKLNIYVKRVVEDSVAGCDGRIRVNDHIVEVNGISLVGVSQKLAAQTLSNCAICPETGTVHFVLARPPPGNEDSSEADDSKAAKDQDKALTRSKGQDKASKDEELQTKKERLKNSATINNVQPNLEKDAAPIRSDVDLSEERPEDKAAQRSSSCETSTDSRKEFVQTPHSILKTQTKPEFEGRDAVRLRKKAEEKRCEDNSAIPDKVIWLKTMLRLTKVTVLAIPILLANSMPGNHTT